MEIELMSSHKLHNFSGKMEDGVSVEKAAFDGIQSMEKLITLLSEHKQKQSPTNSKGDSEIEMDCREVTDVTVNKFRKMITLLDRTRTGHARFRRSHPCDPLQTMQAKDEGNEVKEDKDPLKPKVYCPTPLQRLPPVFHNLNPSFGFINGKKGSSLTNSVGSSLTSDVQNRGPSAFHVASISGGHHPLSSSVFKKRCMTKSEDLNGRCIGSSGRCHCSKKRKFRVKRTMRVPAISLKMADIPPDNFSWRKYGQKPIKGSPYPRGYYKCSSVRGCPARKHVERAIDDPTMLIVTYEGDHNHTISASSHALVPHSSCKKIETK